MHFNSYHSSVSAQTSLTILVEQFEKTIQLMRDSGELENFVYQLEYDKEIGCIEQRTARALAFAAKRLSSPSSYELNDLMEQCGFVPDENNVTALTKAKLFLKPYLGQHCIWENTDYILDEVLIKRYLTEILGFEYDDLLNEINSQKESLDWRAFVNGTTEECLKLIERISCAELDKILLNPNVGHIFLVFILQHKPTAVCLALIDKASSFALEQVLTKQSKETHWTNGIKAAFHNESSDVCLALLKKINHLDNISLSLIDQLAFFSQEILSAQGIARNRINNIIKTYTPFNAIGSPAFSFFLAGSIAIENLKMLNISSFLKSIFSYHSPEILAEFIIKLSLQQRNQLVLPFHLPEVQLRLPHFLLAKEIQSESIDTFYTYLCDYQPLKNKLASDKDRLLTNCIHFYFEGKGEVAPKLKPLFIECLNTKKRPLSPKEKAFLAILKANVSVNTEFEDSDAHEIGQHGVQAWQHYRQGRLQQANCQLQEVLDRLMSADLLFKGSPVCFSNDIDSINGPKNSEDNNFGIQQALDCIRQTKGLVKIIKPQDWKFFMDQLENLHYRPRLRGLVYNSTHKFVHKTEEIVPYQRKRRQKHNYTHTKKTATTLLSPHMNTSVFGEKHETALLVGILFDQAQCQVKAMLLRDSGTVLHSWLGNQSDVIRYKDKMAKVNQTDWDTFAQEVKNRFRHNEVLAKVNKTAMRAIFIAKDVPEARPYGYSTMQ